MVKKEYDELSVAVLALGFLLVVFLNFNEVAYSVTESNPEGIMFLFAGIALAIYAIYHGFSNKGKTQKVKGLLIIFAVIINSVFGIFIFAEMIRGANVFWTILALINIGSAIYLLIKFRLKPLETAKFSDENANKKVLILNLILIALLVAISQFIFEQKWFYTLSLVLALTSIISFIYTKTRINK